MNTEEYQILSELHSLVDSKAEISATLVKIQEYNTQRRRLKRELHALDKKHESVRLQSDLLDLLDTKIKIPELSEFFGVEEWISYYESDDPALYISVAKLSKQNNPHKYEIFFDTCFRITGQTMSFSDGDEVSYFELCSYIDDGGAEKVYKSFEKAREDAIARIKKHYADKDIFA